MKITILVLCIICSVSCLIESNTEVRIHRKARLSYCNWFTRVLFASATVQCTDAFGNEFFNFFYDFYDIYYSKKGYQDVFNHINSYADFYKSVEKTPVETMEIKSQLNGLNIELIKQTKKVFQQEDIKDLEYYNKIFNSVSQYNCFEPVQTYIYYVIQNRLNPMTKSNPLCFNSESDTQHDTLTILKENYLDSDKLLEVYYIDQIHPRIAESISAGLSKLYEFVGSDEELMLYMNEIVINGYKETKNPGPLMKLCTWFALYHSYKTGKSSLDNFKETVQKLKLFQK